MTCVDPQGLDGVRREEVRRGVFGGVAGWG